MNAQAASNRVSMALHAPLPEVPPAPPDGSAPPELRAEVIPCGSSVSIITVW